MRSWLVLKLRQVADELEKESSLPRRVSLRAAFALHRLRTRVLSAGPLDTLLDDVYRGEIEGYQMTWVVARTPGERELLQRLWSVNHPSQTSSETLR